MGSWLLLACELNASPKNLQPHRRGWRGHWQPVTREDLIMLAACDVRRRLPLHHDRHQTQTHIIIRMALPISIKSKEVKLVSVAKHAAAVQ